MPEKNPLPLSTAAWMWEAAKQTPLTFLLAGILVGNIYGWWYSRAAYNDLKSERDTYRQLAYEGLGVLEKVTPSETERAEAKPTATATPKHPAPRPNAPPAAVVTDLKQKLKKADDTKKP